MKSSANVNKVPKKKKGGLSAADNISLFILTLPAIIVLFIWSYLPMSGLVLAFKKYSFRKGIFGSDWVGWDNFETLFKSQSLERIVTNTVGYAIVQIVFGLLTAVIFALLLFEINSKGSVKFIQTTVILPNFLSWVVVGFITYALFQADKGLFNNIQISAGLEPTNFYGEPSLWLFIIPIVHIWKGIGMAALLYYAALMGVDSSLYEAAELDGATRLQQTIHISIPSIKPIIIIQLILQMGSIFRGDFGLFYQIPRNVGTLYPTTDVIDTYVYRALRDGSLEIGTAVGLVQSVVGFVFVVATNLIVKKIDPEQGLF